MKPIQVINENYFLLISYFMINDNIKAATELRSFRVNTESMASFESDDLFWIVLAVSTNLFTT